MSPSKAKDAKTAKTPKTATKKAPALPKPGKVAKAVTAMIPPVVTKKMVVPIRGTSILVQHRWSVKQRDEMLTTQMHIPKPKRGAKNPIEDFISSMYWLTEPPEVGPIEPPKDEQGEVVYSSVDELLVLPPHVQEALNKGKFGVPAAAFRKGMISACRYVDDIEMAYIRGAFFVVGQHADGDIVELQIEEPPFMREDRMTIGQRKPDWRYRGQFGAHWTADVPIEYDPSIINPSQLINLLNRAGFSVGLLEGRPEKSGQWGRYTVMPEKQRKAS